MVNGFACACMHGAATANGQPAAELDLVARQDLAVCHIFGHVLRIPCTMSGSLPNVIHGEYRLVARAIDGLRIRDIEVEAWGGHCAVLAW